MSIWKRLFAGKSQRKTAAHLPTSGASDNSTPVPPMIADATPPPTPPSQNIQRPNSPRVQHTADAIAQLVLMLQTDKTAKKKLEMLLLTENEMATQALWRILQSQPQSTLNQIEVAVLLVRFDATKKRDARRILFSILDTADQEARETISTRIYEGGKLLGEDGKEGWGYDRECAAGLRDFALPLIKSESIVLVRWAAHIFRNSGVKPGDDVSLLFDAMNRGDKQTITDLVKSLESTELHFVPNAEQVVILAKALQQSTESDTSETLIRVLKKAKANAAPAIDVLAAIIKSSGERNMSKSSFSISPPVGEMVIFSLNPSVAQRAASALSDIGVSAVPALTELLSHSDAATREMAADTLKAIGVPAVAAAAQLTKLLNDPNLDVRISAAWALATFSPPQFPAVVDSLLPLLNSSDWIICGRAATILALVGKAGEPAIPLLEKLTNHRESVVAERARKALLAVRADR